MSTEPLAEMVPVWKDTHAHIVSFMLNAALTDSNLGMLITDNDGTIRYINPRYEQITG